jgi:DNA-binding IclR family transcriptional regulator
MTTVQSIDRAFGLLEELSLQPGGISDLARKVGLPTSTVARLLATLEGCNAVERDPDGTVYRIGPSIVTMAVSVDPTQSLLAVAQPHMFDLVDAVAEAVGLAIPAGYDVQYVGQVDCANPVQVRDWTGAKLPMHVVPSGLVILAHWPEEAIERFLTRPLDRYTPNSMVDPDQLRERLAKIRSDGFAWVFEEFSEGINSVAAPLLNSTGSVVGALHSHGPSYRFPMESMDDVIAGRIAATAGAVSEALGHLA